MPPSYLPLAYKAAGMHLEDRVEEYLAGPPGLKMAVFLAEMYRRLGLAAYLMSADSAPLLGFLGKGGRTFLHFLRKGNPDEQATGKATAFFDAIVARDDAGARELSRLSRRQHREHAEYEEDFLYLRYLMDRFRGESEEADRAALLERFETVLDGEDDPRLEVCQSLEARDADQFSTSIAAFVEATGTRLDELSAADQLHPDEAATTAKVSVELVALCLLGAELGLETPRRLRRVPEDLLGKLTPPPHDDEAWKHVPSFREISRKK